VNIYFRSCTRKGHSSRSLPSSNNIVRQSMFYLTSGLRRHSASCLELWNVVAPPGSCLYLFNQLLNAVVETWRRRLTQSFETNRFGEGYGIWKATPEVERLGFVDSLLVVREAYWSIWAQATLPNRISDVLRARFNFTMTSARANTLQSRKWIGWYE
jgi:hypothetical protein